MSSIKLKHSGGNSVSLIPPTSAPTSSDVAFKLPNADGSADQLLKTDGSGNLSFAGSVLQVANSSNAGNATGTTSTSFVDTVNTLNITPQSDNSKIVVFADKLFANIAGQSAGNKKDLVQIQAGQGAASSYRNSWKENF